MSGLRFSLINEAGWWLLNRNLMQWLCIKTALDIFSPWKFYWFSGIMNCNFWQKPKKANFQPFTLLFVLRWGYNSWVRLLKTWGNDWHGAVHPAVCVRDFSDSGNPRKWGSTPESHQKFFKVVCIYVIDPFWHFYKVWQWYVLRFTNFNGEIIIETSKRDFFRRFWGL